LPAVSLPPSIKSKEEKNEKYHVAISIFLKKCNLLFLTTNNNNPLYN